VPDPRSGVVDGSWSPVFAGQRPPFEPGNLAAAKHGAHVADVRLVKEPRTAEIADWVRRTQPVFAPCDDGAVMRLALVYRRLELSAAALDEIDRHVSERPGAVYTEKAAWLARLREDHDRWLSRAGKIEAELGRTPASRAKLGLHLALGRRALTLVELHEAAAVEEFADGGA
jgi:hypothetical protein